MFRCKERARTAHLFPKLPAGQLQGRLLVAAASILRSYLRVSWNELEPAAHRWRDRTQRGRGGGGRSILGRYLDDLWVMLKFRACNWLRQPPWAPAANKVKVHHYWQRAHRGNAACHIIKNSTSRRKWGRCNFHLLIWMIAINFNQAWLDIRNVCAMKAPGRYLMVFTANLHKTYDLNELVKVWFGSYKI